MGLVKEWHEQQLYDEAGPEQGVAQAEAATDRLREVEARLVQEREWAARHPAEWQAWTRVRPLLNLPIDFAICETYEFSQFLAEVGRRPTAGHGLRRLDKSLPYQPGNLGWVKRPTRRQTPAVATPYMTVDEAAAYCRRSRKTVLNHHSLGNVRSQPGTRPPLFRREALDDWLNSRRKSRR